MFIQRYDEVKQEIQQIVDMPDRMLNQLILMIHQNGGALSKRKRKIFEKLNDDEIHEIEEAYRDVFNN